VSDGVEVKRGTNPLDPSDDVPKEVFKAEIGKRIVLTGVVFPFGTADITSESESILTIAFNTLQENPNIEVEIHGHTDNVGKASYNLLLSRQRAESVKQYLVNMGISPDRIVTKGFGAVAPIASNETDKGRQQNRRIEFVRVK
jgi:OOP family OmpA-OmpF porin